MVRFGLLQLIIIRLMVFILAVLFSRIHTVLMVNLNLIIHMLPIQNLVTRYLDIPQTMNFISIFLMLLLVKLIMLTSLILTILTLKIRLMLLPGLLQIIR